MTAKIKKLTNKVRQIMDDIDIDDAQDILGEEFLPALYKLLGKLDSSQVEIKNFQHYADAVAEVCDPETFNKIEENYNLRVAVDK